MTNDPSLLYCPKPHYWLLKEEKTETTKDGEGVVVARKRFSLFICRDCKYQLVVVADALNVQSVEVVSNIVG